MPAETVVRPRPPVANHPADPATLLLDPHVDADQVVAQHQPRSVTENVASRSARVEYVPPVPSPVLELLQTSPPVTPTVSTTSSTSKPFVPAPPVPHPHFLFQAPMSARTRPADSPTASSSSKGSFKRAFASVFSPNAVKPDARPSGAPFRQVNTPVVAPVAAPMDQATRRLRALEIARETGRKAVAYVRRKLNSKTPEDQLPKTWKEFDVLYANGDVDVSDPPLPPQRHAEEGAEPTPFERRYYIAPMGPDEPMRQDVVDRLDLFGRRQMASQVTLDITSPSARSVAMSPTDSLASESSYLTTPSYASSARRHSSSAASTTSTTTAATTANPPSPALDQEAVDSLENSPVFRSIISKAREIFDVPIALVTVLDGDKQMFLASGGLPEGLGNALPRTSSFCQHSILGGGMVVLNATDDWRFAQNMITTDLGGRFYAGTPVNCHAPGETDSAAMPIGSLCVLDTKARSDFGDAHRRVLRDLGQQCANAIEAWSSERRAHKARNVRGTIPTESAPQLAASTSESSTTAADPAARSTTDLARPLAPPVGRAPSLAASCSSTTFPHRRGSASTNPPSSALPATPPASIRHGGAHGPALAQAHQHHRRTISDADSVRTMASSSLHGASDLGSSSAAGTAAQPRRPSALSLGVTTEDPISALPRDVQKMFDAAVRMLARSLELELVYLAALDLAGLGSSVLESDSASVSSAALSSSAAASGNGVRLRVLAAHGLPTPPPSFDPALHVKALRAPEGGLIYKNPRFSPSASASFAAGILIPVLEVRRTGFVLCSYSRDPARQFVQRDLALLVKMAESLETSCVKASKSLPSAAFI
ncbi:uncharacterized protein RHOBADRAFT_50548 [Rhodotorula graminis WP1]|uniref:GAF domain-containing protein n=1 Tax=Rhodotorula graminis (strain WP1) TaxID=578459 RepID=A0A194SET6_RHOGW|nr:uncharacterized protein RHOBADRAFT_50548 [Rhodotorula graminis WP1]KPV78026.1 hypothetical protein RHOBADRAFT_50548 [Rhodotorula graminis WP1]